LIGDPDSTGPVSFTSLALSTHREPFVAVLD
jgi:hypothetical protein